MLKSEVKVGIYCRLSQDDGMNQYQYLTKEKY